MNMFNPPHPGEFIKEVFLVPYCISYRSVAAKLKVSPSTFQRLIKQQNNITFLSPDVAEKHLKKGAKITLWELGDLADGEITELLY